MLPRLLKSCRTVQYVRGCPKIQSGTRPSPLSDTPISTCTRSRALSDPRSVFTTQNLYAVTPAGLAGVMDIVPPCGPMYELASSPPPPLAAPSSGSSTLYRPAPAPEGIVGVGSCIGSMAVRARRDSDRPAPYPAARTAEEEPPCFRSSALRSRMRSKCSSAAVDHHTHTRGGCPTFFHAMIEFAAVVSYDHDYAHVLLLTFLAIFGLGQAQTHRNVPTHQQAMACLTPRGFLLSLYVVSRVVSSPRCRAASPPRQQSAARRARSTS